MIMAMSANQIDMYHSSPTSSRACHPVLHPCHDQLEEVPAVRQCRLSCITNRQFVEQMQADMFNTQIRQGSRVTEECASSNSQLQPWQKEQLTALIRKSCSTRDIEQLLSSWKDDDLYGDGSVHSSHADDNDATEDLWPADDDDSTTVIIDDEPIRISVLLDYLQMATRCWHEDCTNQQCRRGQQYLHLLDRCIRQHRHDRWKPCLHVLKYIARHARDCCSDLCCSMPWCDFFYQAFDRGFSLIEAIDVWYHAYFTSKPAIFMDDQAQCLFTPLSDDSMQQPIQNRDYRALVRLGKFSSVVLAATNDTNPDYWVIKKMKNDPLKNKMLGYMKDENHPNIVEPLWYLVQQGFTYLCCTFAGDSLQSIINSRYPSGLHPTASVWQYAHQILDALRFLHSHQIMFLGWTASNLAVCYDNNIKLCNFRHAVISGPDVEWELVRASLPTAVTPPEIFDEEGIGSFPKSDIWGFACLLYEMTTGYRVHWQHRHEAPDDLLEIMKKKPVPDLIPVITDDSIRCMLTACMQV